MQEKSTTITSIKTLRYMATFYKSNYQKSCAINWEK